MNPTQKDHLAFRYCIQGYYEWLREVGVRLGEVGARVKAKVRVRSDAVTWWLEMRGQRASEDECLRACVQSEL